MNIMFSKSNFCNQLDNWNIQNVESIKSIFENSKSTNIPYWAKIEDYNERLKAYQEYHAKKEKDFILNNLKKNNNLILKPNKDIIKV